MNQFPFLIINLPQRLHWKVRSTFRNRVKVSSHCFAPDITVATMYGFGPSFRLATGTTVHAANFFLDRRLSPPSSEAPVSPASAHTARGFLFR
jgi:hypothetical protein